ncbi:hypothetical protein FisN_20Lh149 [Fistulifera solaris]|uniref:Procollagen-proline 4-dioxygenase n=1 Tax=Fistulifera solaris TaxID=1519565 RepID=A0A1Z5KRY2_FISSO|nr:hypothetical protein FisN_20Lh149 [Fistulifera solaris]|eukprot:GAX28852.1 hypothetical protein FisN_20Lh149 [Fistulifera solaris]
MRSILTSLVRFSLLWWVFGDISEKESIICEVEEECSSTEHPSLPSFLDRWGDFVSTDHPHCVDKNERDCPMKALLNACVKSPDVMLEECPFSCGLCSNYDTEKSQVKTCYGDLQNVNNQGVLEVIRKTQQYMIHQVFVNETYAKIRSSCKNRNVNCSQWAWEGECERNPTYMKKECAPACQTCHWLDIRIRCPFDESSAKERTTWSEPGDLDRFFWSVVRNDTLRTLFSLKVLSGPAEAIEPDGRPGPWVLQLDHFLSAMECERLIDLGHELGFQRSKDIGRIKYDGSTDSYESKSRTSSTAWCTESSVCGKDAIQQKVTQRIEQLVQIPINNSEALQLLRYEENQYYKVHHDYTPLHAGSMAGVRILTVFLYLNDDRLEGGGTNFPSIHNLTVLPNQGRAILWPSVLNDEPGQIDVRTEHQALPVERGVKYAANAWIHQRDFRTPLHMGCGV